MDTRYILSVGVDHEKQKNHILSFSFEKGTGRGGGGGGGGGANALFPE